MAFVVAGILIPCALLPFSTGRIKSETLFENVKHSYISLRENNKQPVFEVVKKGEEKTASQTQLVQFETTQLFMEFPSSTKILELQAVVRARFPDNKLLPDDPDSCHIRFKGWSGHDALALPFRYVVVAGLFLMLAGSALMYLIRK